ncbi:MAG: PAS domain S-box protein, partial [Elusimicrobiota bacterium]
MEVGFVCRQAFQILFVLGLAELAATTVLDFIWQLPPGRLHLFLDVSLGIVLAGPYLYCLISREARLRKSSEAAALRRGRMQSALCDLAALALRDSSLEDLLDMALERLLAGGWLQADAGGRVFMPDAGRCRLVLKAWRGRGPAPRLGLELDAEASGCGLAMKSGRVEFWTGEASAGAGGRAHYCVPIKAGAGCLGVIQLYAGSGYRRDELDLIFLEAAGSLVGVILAHRHAEVERLRLGAAIGQSSDAVVVTDTQGIVGYVNPAFTRIIGRGREEALGREMRSVNPCREDDGSVYDRIFSAVGGGEAWNGRFSGKRKDGSDLEAALTVLPVRDASGNIINYVFVLRDSTDEVNMEAQMRQAQKLEAVGLLAGGIAHDFNNVLTTIIGYNYFISDGLEAGSPLRAFSQEIRRSAEVAASLSRQILSISRKQAAQLRVMDINTVIMDTAKMFRRLLGENVKLAMDTHPALWPIKIDSGQLEQVILNLIINARDAMPKGGEITLETA